MNTQHRDILTAIGRKQPISTAGITEYLMDTFGYGGGMSFETFRDQVSKSVGYLKSKGDIAGEDRPQAKGKPLRYWSLATAEEMASDVAELKQPQPVVKESLTTEAVTEESSVAHKENVTVETTTPELVSVDVKVTHKPLTARQLLDAFEESGESFQGDLCDFRLFSAGAEFAEKHHGIGP